MINNKAYCFAFIGAIVALATYRYSIYSKKGEVEQIASLLTKNFEKQISHYKKISVGYATNLCFLFSDELSSKDIVLLARISASNSYRTNANIDLIVSGVALLNKLGILPPKYGKHCSEIDSLDVLGECFMYFMSKGAAGERPIATQQLNAEIVHAASLIENSQVTWTNLRSVMFRGIRRFIIGGSISEADKSIFDRRGEDFPGCASLS